MADVTVKKLSEFTTATLSDNLLVAVSSANGTGYKSTLSDVRDYVSADTGYYTCSTAADTSAKTVTASGFNLRTGGSMHIMFTYTNTANAVTLNIGSTGDYPLLLNGTQASSTQTWAAGDIFELFFDGTSWRATSADAAVESKYEEVIAEINSAKTEALAEIATAIEGLNLYYETI